MKSYPDKKILFSLLFLGIFASFVGTKFENYGGVLTQKLSLTTASVVPIPDSSLPSMSPLSFTTPPPITLGFVGDIMLDRDVKRSVEKNFAGDYSKLFANTDFLKTPDIMFANLEGTASNLGTDQHAQYPFHMNPAVIPLLKNAGIDVVSIANNHENDYGVISYVDTINRLKQADILTCGGGLTKADAVQPAVVEKDGYKVGFLCFTDVGPDEFAATATKPGLLIASDPDFDSIIKNAAGNVDALIVSFHWGVEYRPTHTARQAELARRAIDDGAVMIEGGHPHVSADMETYNGAPIFYSLGNFIFDQPFSKDTMQGLFVTATLSGKTISDVTEHTVVLDQNFTPALMK